MQPGTKLYVERLGEIGEYVSCKTSLIGGNQHTIQVGAEAHTLKLRDEAWHVWTDHYRFREEKRMLSQQARWGSGKPSLSVDDVAAITKGYPSSHEHPEVFMQDILQQIQADVGIEVDITDQLQLITSAERELGLSSDGTQAERLWKLCELLELPVPSCLLYTSPSPRDKRQSRMPSSA